MKHKNTKNKVNSKVSAKNKVEFRSDLLEDISRRTLENISIKSLYDLERVVEKDFEAALSDDFWKTHFGNSMYLIRYFESFETELRSLLKNVNDDTSGLLECFNTLTNLLKVKFESYKNDCSEKMVMEVSNLVGVVLLMYSRKPCLGTTAVLVTFIHYVDMFNTYYSNLKENKVPTLPEA